MRATGCPPITRFTTRMGPLTLEGFGPDADGVGEAFCTRRMVLDKVLVDAAVAAGAELREGFSVQELLVEDGRVVGMRGRDRTGAVVEEQARVVVGADGLHSFVARAVDAPT